MKKNSTHLLSSLTAIAATATTLFAFSVQAKKPQTEVEPIRIEITIEDGDVLTAIQGSERAEVPHAKMVVFHNGNETQSVDVKMSTRGLTSLAKFSRKNFSVKSKDGVKIEIGHIKGKNLVLSASPEDILGTKNKFAYKMLTFAGIRSFNPQYAEVMINGNNRGLYFVTKSADDEILKANDNQAECVLRRRYADKIEMKGQDKKLEKGTCDKYVAALTDLHKKVRNLQGEELLSTLSESLNLETYMKWLALNYLLKNGDYSDEVYFFGTTKNGRISFDILPWDNDDIDSASAHLARVFGSPNHGREEASRRILIRSYESSLDKAIAKDPVLLNKYFSVASALMKELASKNAIQLSIGSLISELSPYLENSAVLNAGSEDSIHRPHNREDVLDSLKLRITDTQLQMAKINDQLLQNATVAPSTLVLVESDLRSLIDKVFMNVLQWATEAHRRPLQKPNPLYN